MNNVFQEFLKGHERYFHLLSMHMNSVKEYPAYDTLVRSSYIAHKMKAEFSAMVLFYKTIAIPEAENIVEELRKCYQDSTLQGDYPELDQTGIFEDSFRSVMREVLMSGYISISHKIENLVDFVKNHSGGTPFASMVAPNHKIVNYLKVLESEFNLPFAQLVETEHRTKIEHVHDVITPRIHRIRVAANRIKHQGGYPKRADDIIIQYFSNFKLYKSDFHRCRIPFSIREFLVDLDYAEKYIDVILELINNTHIYSIIKEVLKQPIIKGQEQYRYSLEYEQMPNYHSHIQHLVQRIRDRKLDIHLGCTDNYICAREQY